MSDDIPVVSVAISTHQRAHLLGRLVSALEEQTLPHDSFEVVIVDDGNSDGTDAVLQDLVRGSSLHLCVLRLDANCGPAVGRNLAWRHARAPIIAFTDDDCVPTPGWLESGVAAIRGGRRVVVGRTMPAPDQAHLLREPFTRTMKVTDARWFATCNVFYRREDLERVGGFDEGFPTPGGEDTDLGIRVCAAGVDSVFSEDALVHHDVRPSSLGATVRETLRWNGVPRLVQRHPEVRRTLLHRRIFWKRSHPPVILAALGLVASTWRRPALVLTLPWLWHRLHASPVCSNRRDRVAALPGAFVVDGLEVLVMARWGLRYRAIVL
jgi:GT2 family glycosyltransferase